MQRISSPTAVAALPAVIPGGTPGFFAQVTPGVGVPTIMSPDWANGVQEELIAIILSGGINPSLSTLTQVRDAVMAYGYFADTGAANAYVISTAVSGVAGGSAFAVPAVQLVKGTKFLILAKTSSTGAAQITIDGNPVLAWTNNAGGALVAGDIVAGSLYPVIYDGTALRMQAVTNGQIAAAIAAAVAAALASSTTTTTTIAGASHSFVAADTKKTIKRTNGGAAMIDLLPGATAGALPAGWTVMIVNNDPAGLYALTCGPGSGLASPTNFSNNVAYVGPGQSFQVTSDGTNYAVTNAPARAKLTTNTTLFTSPTGSNTGNPGITSATPFATETYAYEWAQNVLDVAGFSLSIDLAAGARTTGIFCAGPLVGQASPVIFQGAGSASTSISPAAANAILAQGDAVITINGVKLSSGAGSCILAIDAGTIVNQGTDVNIGASPSYQLFTQYGGKINVTASYTVSGSSATGHFENYGGQTIVTAGITITFVGTLSFGAFASADFSGGALFAAGITFAGSFASVTGTKYGAQYGGLVFTQGAGINYFPGSIAGSALAGGIYA